MRLGRFPLYAGLLCLALALVGPAVGASAAHRDDEPLTKERATAETRKALKAEYGEKWTHGRHRRVRCEASEDNVFRCSARWRYRGREFRRTVLVIDRNGSLSVSIFPA